MKDPVDRTVDVEVVRDVVGLIAEPLVGEAANEVVDTAREQGVEAEDLPSFGQEPLAEMGAEEARPSRHQRARHVSGSCDEWLARSRSRRSPPPSSWPARTGSARPRRSDAREAPSRAGDPASGSRPTPCTRPCSAPPPSHRPRWMLPPAPEA